MMCRSVTGIVNPPMRRPRRMERAGPREVDGPSGPEPTRYGDWEAGGRCIDF